MPASYVDYAGCRFKAHLADNYTEYVLWLYGRPPEHDATRFLQEFFWSRSIVVVDIGANAGVFSLPVIKAAHSASTLILFEPNPVLRRRLAVNLRLNQFTNAQVIDTAIGAREARSILHFPANPNLGEARVDLPFQSSPRKGIDVQVKTLPVCLRELKIEHVDLLKVDIEGFEDRAIAPLLDDESAPQPELIYFEDAHRRLWKQDLTGMLEACGYQLLRRFGPNALYRLNARPE